MKNVIFMGTPQIAAVSLQALIDAGFNVMLAVSQPDKPKGRGNKIQPTPVKEVAEKHNIPVFQPDKIKNNPEAYELLKSYDADFFAVVAYGKILPKEILDIPKYAPVNVHFSLLPKYRGAAPVNWAILNGDESTGVDTMKMGVGMDDGDILLSEKVPIQDKTAIDLAGELSVKGAELLIRTLREYETIEPKAQDHDKATFAPMLQKEDGLIKWGYPADFIWKMTRALVPWPVAHTYMDGKLLKIYGVNVDPAYQGDERGVIYHVGKDSFCVGTSNGGVIVKELQIEGKRRMTAAEFLAGYKPAIGTKLG